MNAQFKGIRKHFAYGIRNPTNDWNPESRIQVLQKNSGIQCLESGIHGEESRIQDCPGFPYMR